MIACEVTKSGQQQKVTLSLPEATGWSDRFPRVRTDNGVTIVWWDLDGNQPIEKVKWDARKKLLKLPIPFAKPVEDVGPQKGAEPVGVSISVPPSTTAVVLGTLRVSQTSADRIKYAIAQLNEYLAKQTRMPSNPTGESLWEDLMREFQANFSPEAVSKLDQAIQQLGAEIDTRLDALRENVAAIEEARSRIDFLRGLRQKWSGPAEAQGPSDIGM